ncbi:MAG: hypothetical protein IMZ44_19490, partial [Planctomycetes bacterium]|nr:hypothetical protein [Planctomycetota bacterium]
PVESGDGWNPDEFILHGGSTLTSSNAALVLGYTEPITGTNYLAYPTIKSASIPVVNLGGDINFRSGIKVEGGLADINVVSGNVQFTRDLTTGVGGPAPTMDMIRNLSVQGGQAGIYNTHTQTAATTIAAGAKLVFDPNASITYAGSIVNNGKVMATTGTTDLGTTVITSTAPQYQYVAALSAGRLSGSFNTTAANPNQDLEPDLSKMNYSGSAPYTGQPTSVTYPSGIWADNMTWVYSGQWHQNATGLVSFSENFDDSVMLKIDLNGDSEFGTDETLLNNGAWATPTSSAGTMLAEGWYNFEVRFGQGSGGVGPVNQAGENYQQGGGMALGWDSEGRGVVTYANHQNIPSADFRSEFRLLLDEGSLYVASGATVLAGGLDNLGLVQVGGTLTLAGPGSASARGFSIGGQATMTSLTGTGTDSELTVGGTLDVSGAAAVNKTSISGTANVASLTGNGTSPTTSVANTGTLNLTAAGGLTGMASLDVKGVVNASAGPVSATDTVVGEARAGSEVAGALVARGNSAGSNLNVEYGTADYGTSDLAMTGTVTIGTAYVAPLYDIKTGLLGGRIALANNVTQANPGDLGIRPEPEMGFTDLKPPWGDNETYVYTGQYWSDGGNDKWQTDIDDLGYVKIDDVVYISNSGNSNSISVPIALTEDWHDIEIRVGNGGGGAGPTRGAPGVGVDFTGTATAKAGFTEANATNVQYRYMQLLDPGYVNGVSTLIVGNTTANVLNLINGSATVGSLTGVGT